MLNFLFALWTWLTPAHDIPPPPPCGCPDDDPSCECGFRPERVRHSDWTR